MVTSIVITSKSKSFIILYKLYVSEADLEAESINSWVVVKWEVMR